MKSAMATRTVKSQPRSFEFRKKPDLHKEPHDDAELLGWFPAMTTYFSYGILMLYGYIRDFIDRWLGTGPTKLTKPGYAPICRDFEEFYRRRLYARIQDCWNRPIESDAGRHIDVVERKLPVETDPLKPTGNTIRCLNLSSYNYLGFCTPGGPCEKDVMDSIEKYGISTSSPVAYAGRTELLDELETEIAAFVGKPDAMVFGMGFGVNSTGIPALIGKGSLIISDSLNHSSIVVGARNSGAKIKVFRHNDIKQLEQIVRDAIAYGQPRTHRPYKKILIIVEGIYSMEGEICDLASIVRVKKKYKCFLYVDEAHSIGALGNSGRGVCEYACVDPADIDILMGTFTKSFGAIGGYVAGSKSLINYVRKNCSSQMYSSGLSPPCIAQTLSALRIIEGKDGTGTGRKKINQLQSNANYVRERLEKMGVWTLGDRDSAVVPVMIANPAKMPAVSRECLKRNLAVVVVGFPATPILTSRVRFCLSASHTRKDLEEAMDKFDEVAEICHIKYNKKWTG